VTGALRARRFELLVAAVAASWGAIGLIVKHVSLDAAAVVTWRVSLAAVTVGAFALCGLRRPGRLAVPRGRRLAMLSVAALLACHWWLYFLTIKLSTVTVAVVFAYLAPVVSAALATRLLGERISRAVGIALAAALAGTLLIVVDGTEGSARIGPLAIVTGLGTALSYVGLTLRAKHVRATVPALAFSFWEQAGVAAILGPVAVAGSGLVPPSGRELGYLLVLGVVLTGVAGTLWVVALGPVSVQRLAILSYLEPVSAAVLAAAVLGERLSPIGVAGGGLVVGAGLLAIGGDRDAAAERSAATRAAPSA